MPSFQLHSVHCLVDVPVCVGSLFNILIDPDDESSDSSYTEGYYMTSNDLLVAVAHDVGSCSDCTNGYDGDIEKGLRLQVTGIVQEDADGKHQLEPTAVMVAEEGQTECDDLSATAAPTAAATATQTMSQTAAPTSAATATQTMAQTAGPTAAQTAAQTATQTAAQTMQVTDPSDAEDTGAAENVEYSIVILKELGEEAP